MEKAHATGRDRIVQKSNLSINDDFEPSSRRVVHDGDSTGIIRSVEDVAR